MNTLVHFHNLLIVFTVSYQTQSGYSACLQNPELTPFKHHPLFVTCYKQQKHVEARCSGKATVKQSGHTEVTTQTMLNSQH